MLHSDDARSKALKKAKPQAEAVANPCSAWDRISLDLHIPSLLFKNPDPNDFIPYIHHGKEPIQVQPDELLQQHLDHFRRSPAPGLAMNAGKG